MFERGADFLRFVAVRDFNLFLALAHKTRVESGRLGPGKVSINCPVFFFLERLDLTLALDNQPQRDRLNTACGEPPANFVPKQR